MLGGAQTAAYSHTLTGKSRLELSKRIGALRDKVSLLMGKTEVVAQKTER